MSTPLAHALELSAKNVPCFPCIDAPGTEQDKAPACANGFYDACTDPGILRKWFLSFQAQHWIDSFLHPI